jgi:hypothetical protein
MAQKYTNPAGSTYYRASCSTIKQARGVNEQPSRLFANASGAFFYLNTYLGT